MNALDNAIACRRCGRGTFHRDGLCSRPTCRPLPSDVDMPWCDPCGSYHAATAPGCKAGSTRAALAMPERRPETVHEQAARAIVADDLPTVRARLAALLRAGSELASASQSTRKDARKNAVAKYEIALADLHHVLGLPEQNDKP